MNRKKKKGLVKKKNQGRSSLFPLSTISPISNVGGDTAPQLSTTYPSQRKVSPNLLEFRCLGELNEVFGPVTLGDERLRALASLQLCVRARARTGHRRRNVQRQGYLGAIARKKEPRVTGGLPRGIERALGFRFWMIQ